MRKSFDFITGATGFVGSALVLELLSRTERTLVCLVRAEDSFAAYERLQSTLHEAALAYGCEQLIPEIFSRCVAVAGDLQDPGFGANLNHLGTPGDFWHCAASLEFDESRTREIFQNNLHGTRNALDVARSLGAERFLHVSTAYVCGQRLGNIPEEAPNPETGFHNPYEASKAQTELMLLQEREMDVRIIRPSIVIGNSRNFACTGPARTASVVLPNGTPAITFGTLRTARSISATLIAARVKSAWRAFGKIVNDRSLIAPNTPVTAPAMPAPRI